MRILIALIFCLLNLVAGAQDGFEIKIEIEGYEEPQLSLAYYLGDKQYIQDTVDRAEDGTYTFAGEEALPGGIYLAVMAPDNNFFQLLIDDQNQHFSVKTTNGADQLEKTKFINSADNENFYNYLLFLADQRKTGTALQEKMEGETDETAKAGIQEELEGLGDQVLTYQKKLVADHPNSMAAAIIQANIPVTVPELEGETPEATNEKKWRWMQKHYFDNIDLSDGRMLRTPFMYQQVDHYLKKLQVQHPDTLATAIDFVLDKMKDSDEVFKYYLITLLNEYAGSKFVGMDAVYVHLVDNYYAKGLAPWTEEEQLTKITDNAERLRPLLIGRIAPDITMERQDGSKITLSEIESPYTVLYFWRYDCGHCKKSTPYMKEFYEKFHDRGVEVFAACAKLRDEIPACWDYIDENEIGEWIHVVDPYNRSRYMQTYDLKSTPQIYVLDADKKIISKRLGAEQLEELFTRLLEQEAEEEAPEQR